ncbi:hypothetical protein [Nocardioides sp. zg-DK7169]|uniref:hypothetical protein n=1 Tax=Nocardioides sp. zg-DK7169 TaxID=2736600 RepID=UPI001556E261|nr:hypothetical protein [Nocardioides sp. zg-DK7169]NPC97924.1 hypothetical protein [Nocardioides sp. zg-DK7169]
MRRPLVSLAAAVVPLVLLSGCGPDGTDLRPGTAAVVDEEVVSMGEVEDVTESLCSVLVAQAQNTQPGQPAAPAEYPMGIVRSAAQRGLALNIAADQIAAEQGIDVEDDLRAGIDTIRNAYQGADPEQLEEAMPGFTGDGHLDLVLTEWGARDLSPGASEEEARARGYELGAEWAEDHGLESNPLFDSLVIGEGGVAGGREDLSVPVSDWARMAAAPASQAEAAEVTAGLPANQRCGA